jgi:hypothetical protein
MKEFKEYHYKKKPKERNKRVKGEPENYKTKKSS